MPSSAQGVSRPSRPAKLPEVAVRAYVRGFLCKGFHSDHVPKPFFSIPFRAEFEVNSDALKAVQQPVAGAVARDPMSLARIITGIPEASRHLEEALRARGFEVETRPHRADSAVPNDNDLEIQLEECDAEEALQLASLEAGRYGFVFIGPGAIAEDFRPIAMIPFLPSAARETLVTRERIPEKPVPEKSIAEFEVLPAEAASETVAVVPIVEPEIAEIPARTFTPVPVLEQPVFEEDTVASEAESISDLVILPPSAESESEANLETITATVEEAPVLLEAETILPAETASPAMIPGPPEEPAAEIYPQEVSLSEAQLPDALLLEAQSDVPQTSGQIVYTHEIVGPTVQPELAGAEVLKSEVPDAPLADVEEVAPVICEERRAEPDVAVAAVVGTQAPRPIQPALATRVSSHKVRISLPRLQRSFYYWGAAALAAVIGVEALVLISAAPRAGKVQNSSQQLPLPPARNAASVAKASVSKPAAVHHSSRAADEGYVAKNTVIRYGARPATSAPAKSSVKTRSVQN